MKWPLFSALCLMPLIASAATSPDPIAQGNDKKVHGDFKGAIDAYTEAITQNPKDPRPYLERATVRDLQRDFDGAIVDDTQAISLDSKNAIAFSNRGNARASKGDLKGAISDYTQAIALDPHHFRAFLNRGGIQSLQRNYHAAIADYNQVLALDPKNAAAFYDRGTAKRALKDYAGAEADYTQAIALNAVDVPAYLNRAVLRMAQRNWTGAEADLDKCLSLLPQERQAYPRLYLWVIGVNRGEADKATQTLAQYFSPGSAKFDATWPWQIGKFVMGQMDEATFLASAKSVEEKKEKGQTAQAFYYAGLKHAIAGDKAGAAKFFKQCQQSGNRSLHEVVLAREALKTSKGTSK